jgi:hypothetical protein
MNVSRSRSVRTAENLVSGKGQINPQKDVGEGLVASEAEGQAAAERGYSGVMPSKKQPKVFASNVPASDSQVGREIDRVVNLLASGSMPFQKQAAVVIRRAVDEYLSEGGSFTDGAGPTEGETEE